MQAPTAWLTLSLCLATFSAHGEPSAERRDELRAMLHQDCGSCHGLTLKGGLGPALLPSSLAGKPRDYLIATILDGRPGTAMPPWRPLLAADEVAWMVDLMLEQQEASR